MYDLVPVQKRDHFCVTLPNLSSAIEAMHIQDPYCWLSPTARKWLWIGCLVISALCLWAMMMLDQSLVTDAAPSGILSFEFSGSLPRARQILASWDADRKIIAALSLGIDYLFLVAYALFISNACAYLAGALGKRRLFLVKTGFLLAWAQFPAALLDAIENAALIRLLLGDGQDLYARMAWGCAGIKFTLVGAGLAYMVLGFLIAKIFPTGADQGISN